MAKKRQQDFSRIQLRPGRAIQRANNPPYKFKSRKISVPKEKVIKMKSELTITDYLRKIKNATNDKDKSNFLFQLNRLIKRQTESLNAYLHQFFDSVFINVKDIDDNIRDQALNVMISVFENTDDLQLHTFGDMICTQITTIMKNPNKKIASVSLTLLDSMLQSHPNLICHNMNILQDLLPTERLHYTRKVINEKDRYKYSANDEINALGHISAFLKNILLLKNKNDLTKKEEEEEEKVVNVDGKVPVSVVLYVGGGLQPIDIEKACAAQFNPQVNPFQEVDKLMLYIDSLLKHILTYFCQIISTESNADDNAFRNEPIKDLSILIELLCHVAELAEKFSYAKAVEEIASFLKEKVFPSNGRKRFPFELHSVMPDIYLQHLALLNASLCYLHMKYLSSDESFYDDGELIKRYIRYFFSVEKKFSSEMKCQCIPYFIKMIQLCENKTDFPEVIPLLLKNLVPLVKIRLKQPNKMMLKRFLMDMSVLPGYKFWFNTEPMMVWYDYLIGHLKDSAKLSKEIGNMICKIATLKHPSFLELLDLNVIKSLLTKRESRETAIFLLHNMDIDCELLKTVYNVMYQDTFPLESAVTLIHMLNVRFNHYPASERPYVDYIEFLLNIAIDVFNFSKSKFIDVKANDYTKAVQLIRNGHRFCIIPSLHWKDHERLFNACFQNLGNLPLAPVSLMYMRTVRELLHSSTLIPIHCALAILKLDNSEIKNKHHRSLMVDLNLSCLLTTSVLTQTNMNDDWYKWNVCELMESVSLSEHTVVNTLKLLLGGNFGRDPPDALVVYHILRVIKVFVERRLLDYECTEILDLTLRVFQSLADKQCTDKTIRMQPLYQQLFDFFVKIYCE